MSVLLRVVTESMASPSAATGTGWFSFAGPFCLELWNTSQSPGQRLEDKIRWAKELLSSYLPAGGCDEEELW